MAKNYTKESYAVNKYSDGIVYRGAEFDYELTLEDFLRENPNMTQADFEYWKNISDELYKEEAVKLNAITRKEVPIEEIEDTTIFSVESAESEFLRFEEEGKLTAKQIKDPIFILEIAKSILPEIQYKRFIGYYLENKKLAELAAEEAVCPSSISRSLNGAEKKIKKFLSKLCKKNGIFDI